MKSTAILSCLILITTAVYAQRTIRGRVTSAANGKSVPGSSVFLSNTSIGTVSDSSGNFELNNLPYGRYDLVISSIGYETQVANFTTEQLPLELKIEMKIKVRDLENVTVEPSVEEGWDRWGDVFIENFIGRTPNAARCKIKNHKAIKFRYFKKSGRMIAYCDEPLIIENNALGYRITYQLEDFELDMKQGTTSYAGYPFFEDKAYKRANRYLEPRDKAYYGSILHFMRSIYTDSLVENGFEVHRMVRIENFEKERVKKIYKPFNNKDTTLSEDSFRYYQRVMQQKDYTDRYYNDALTADSLVVKEEGEFKQVFFPDFLYVIYRRENENQMYLSYTFTARKPMYQSSHLFLVSGQPVYIDAGGTHYPAEELFSIGYWAWSEKIGEMLPTDYKPANYK
jgi:hypothetical protein